MDKIENINEYDIITYIPISKKRMRERGYNQSYLICKEICKKFNKKPVNILKKYNSEKQAQLSKEQRIDNIKGKFELIYNVENKKVLIIDDVYTTGSTMNEAIKETQKGNPSKISAYILFKR